MKKLRDWYDVNFLVAEFIIGVAGSVIAVLGIELLFGRSEMAEFLKTSRQPTYAAVASITGALLGFVLTAVSIVLVINDSPALTLVRQGGHYKQVFDIYFQAVLWLSLATVWAFVGLLGDTDTSPRAAITYIMGLLLVVVGLRLYRCVWILQRVTNLVVSYHEAAGRQQQIPGS